MVTQSIQNEQEKFSARLVEALHACGISPGATNVWREFNRVYDGRPVSVHAVRKWLTGEAIPSQDRIKALSDWLSIAPHWLRFGDESIKENQESLQPDERRLLSNLRFLSADERQRLIALVQVMASTAKKRIE